MTLAAATLSIRHAAVLGALAILCTLVLSFFYLPLPWRDADSLELPLLYRAGMAIAITAGICFTAGYAWFARREASRMELALDVTQTVLADMTDAGWGRIVNVSAIGAQSGATHMAHYTASKGGLIAMTKSLAVELGARGVTVNSVSPGFILTPMSQRAIDGGLFPVPAEQIYGAYPIPRLGRPEEIAAACAYLVSEDAGYVTGQVLAVNGGAYV